MTIRMQGGWAPLSTAKLNEINARQWVWYRCFGICIAVVNESMPVPSSDVISFGYHDLEKIDKSIRLFKNW